MKTETYKPKGRPKLPRDMRTKQWGLRLSYPATQKLPALARAARKSPAQFVSQLIEAI